MTLALSFVRHRKPFWKEGMARKRVIELVDKGTDMMLKSTIHDLYNEEMREKAYSSHHDQMTHPGDALFRQDCTEYSL